MRRALAPPRVWFAVGGNRINNGLRESQPDNMTFYTFDPAITLRAAMARHVDCDTLEGAKCEVSNGKDLCMVVPDLDTMLGTIKDEVPIPIPW